MEGLHKHWVAEAEVKVKGAELATKRAENAGKLAADQAEERHRKALANCETVCQARLTDETFAEQLRVPEAERRVR